MSPKYAVVYTPLLSVYKENTVASECISQLLFGELFEVIAEKDKWSYIKNIGDEVVGWVQNFLVYNVDNKEFERISQRYTIVNDAIVELVTPDSGHSIKILPGSSLPIIEGAVRHIDLGDKKYMAKTRITEQLSGNVRNQIKSKATVFLNSPYIHGGRSLFGIDTASLIQLVYKINGIQFPRFLENQRKQGEAIPLIEVEVGDLLFFYIDDTTLYGGIYLGNDDVLHCYDYVRIDKIIDNSLVLNGNKSVLFDIVDVRKIIF